MFYSLASRELFLESVWSILSFASSFLASLLMMHFPPVDLEFKFFFLYWADRHPEGLFNWLLSCFQSRLHLNSSNRGASGPALKTIRCWGMNSTYFPPQHAQDFRVTEHWNKTQFCNTSRETAGEWHLAGHQPVRQPALTGSGLRGLGRLDWDRWASVCQKGRWCILICFL